MTKMTLAIPTYNTSNFFEDSIKYAIDNEFVSEIVVNDDASSEEHWNNLNKIVDDLKTDKIKLFRNKENLGAFRNKFITASNCTNDWIYLLDSDNSPLKTNYEIFESVDKTDRNRFYCPERLFCKTTEQFYTGENLHIADFDFGHDIIGIKELKELIDDPKDVNRWFLWFFGNGNYFFNRHFYMECLSEVINDYSEYESKILCDTAVAFYFILKNGGKFSPVRGIAHKHRMRPNSYWHTCGKKAQESFDHYHQLARELN